MYFVPSMQRPKSSTNPIENDLSLYAGALVIETDRPMPHMERLARNTLSSINPNLAIVKFQTFEQQIADQFTSERMIARLSLTFGGLALLLAMIGLYGVTAYTFARRTPEIGIRMAVGAERGNITAMVLRGAFFQIVVGLLVGIPIALVCVRFVKAQLYEIKSASPFIVIGAIATLTFAASVAAWIPARRAASIDPAEALRIE
jgi:ABC-type antimicrobial peptide transport system permease subunit